MNDDLILFFAVLGVMATILWLGIGIGAALRYLVQLHADRVVRMAKPKHCSRCTAYSGDDPQRPPKGPGSGALAGAQR